MPHLTLDIWLGIVGLILAIVAIAEGIVLFLEPGRRAAKARGAFLKSDIPQRARSLIETALYGHLPRAMAREFSQAWLETIAGKINATNVDDHRRLLRLTRLFLEQMYVDCAQHTTPNLPQAAGWPAQTAAQHLESLNPTLTRAKNLFDAIDTTPPHEIETAFTLRALEDATPPVSGYFKGLRDLALDAAVAGPNDRFLSRVCIQSGFITPLLLLTGLLKQMHENWPRALAKFPIRIEDNPIRKGDTSGDRLEHVQAFEFYCWALWGPSIAFCTCALWEQGQVRILQYGFGDENNSIHLIFDDDTLWRTSRQQIEQELIATKTLAVQAKITATPMWGPNSHITFPPVYNAGDPALGLTHMGLLLRCEETVTGPVLGAPNVLYYSAYLWIMFEIYDPNSTLGWRRYFPIFEHGNIADGTTFLVLKRQLVRKALSTIRGFERPESFRYVCAVDDPGAAGHQLRFGMASADESLRALLKAEAGAGMQTLFEPASLKSSCHLPELIREFYLSL